MGNLIRRVLAPIISFFLLMFGSGFLQTFISARLHLDGQSASLIGFVQGAFYLGYLVAVLKIEHLIGRIRHIRAFSFFVSIATVIILLQGLVLSPYAWILIRIINGVCIASLYVVVESWLLIAAPDSHRGAVLAI